MTDAAQTLRNYADAEDLSPQKRVNLRNAASEIERLRVELDALKRNNAYCPMCGSGTVPSVQDDESLLRQALEALENVQEVCTEDECGRIEAATVWTPEIIAALRERLK